MPKTKLKCPKCPRTFSMPAHLARHMSTIHSTGAKKAASKPAKRKKGAGKRAGPKPRASIAAPGMFAGDAGQRVVAEMQAYRDNLLAMRGEIEMKLGAIEQAMGAMGSTALPVARAKPGRRAIAKGRPAASGVRPGTLKDAVLTVLRTSGTGMSPRALSDAVIKAGYKTKAKDLTKAISNLLPQVKAIKRVGHGIYTL